MSRPTPLSRPLRLAIAGAALAGALAVTLPPASSHAPSGLVVNGGFDRDT
ncbi:hypothetical protein [Streptomyces sp. NPDC055709]